MNKHSLPKILSGLGLALLSLPAWAEDGNHFPERAGFAAAATGTALVGVKSFKALPSVRAEMGEKQKLVDAAHEELRKVEARVPAQKEAHRLRREQFLLGELREATATLEKKSVPEVREYRARYAELYHAGKFEELRALPQPSAEAKSLQEPIDEVFREARYWADKKYLASFPEEKEALKSLADDVLSQKQVVKAEEKIYSQVAGKAVGKISTASLAALLALVAGHQAVTFQGGSVVRSNDFARKRAPAPGPLPEITTTELQPAH